MVKLLQATEGGDDDVLPQFCFCSFVLFLFFRFVSASTLPVRSGGGGGGGGRLTRLSVSLRVFFGVGGCGLGWVGFE